MRAKGIWDEKAKAWIAPAGTVAQGRRPMFRPFKPKIQGYRKLGHLWQAAYGPTIGEVRYGYGITRKQASANARAGKRVQ